MKKPIAVLLAMVLLLTACGFAKADSEQPAAGERAEASGQETAETLKKSPEILAIYSCPATQIIIGEDNTKELADTVIFLYKDLSYVQYVENGCVYFTEAGLQEYIARSTHRAKPKENNITYRKPHANVRR